jgi:hypothetical protein
VTIDVGVVPGRVSKFRGSWRIHDSPVLDAMSDWKTPEAVRFLQMGVAREPSARAYEALLDVGDGHAARVSYLYDRRADVIQISTGRAGENLWVSEPLRGDVGNVKSLARNDLKPRTTALP